MAWLSIKEFIIDLIKLIVVVVVILFLMIYVGSVTQVVGNSMYSTLEDGDVLQEQETSKSRILPN